MLGRSAGSSAADIDRNRQLIYASPSAERCLRRGHPVPEPPNGEATGVHRHGEHAAHRFNRQRRSRRGERHPVFLARTLRSPTWERRHLVRRVASPPRLRRSRPLFAFVWALVLVRILWREAPVDDAADAVRWRRCSRWGSRGSGARTLALGGGSGAGRAGCSPRRSDDWRALWAGLGDATTFAAFFVTLVILRTHRGTAAGDGAHPPISWRCSIPRQTEHGDALRRQCHGRGARGRRAGHTRPPARPATRPSAERRPGCHHRPAAASGYPGCGRRSGWRWPSAFQHLARRAALVRDGARPRPRDPGGLVLGQAMAGAFQARDAGAARRAVPGHPARRGRRGERGGARELHAAQAARGAVAGHPRCYAAAVAGAARPARLPGKPSA